jgi:hypothetical protein
VQALSGAVGAAGFHVSLKFGASNQVMTGLAISTSIENHGLASRESVCPCVCV